jgi:hypothetical protein
VRADRSCNENKNKNNIFTKIFFMYSGVNDNTKIVNDQSFIPQIFGHIHSGTQFGF